MIKLILKPILLLFFLSSCVHIERPHDGIIKDADSGEPISGVVVHLDLESGFLDSFVHGHTEWKDSSETFSDDRGLFRSPLKIEGQVPFELSIGHTLTLFKAGYFESRILEPSYDLNIVLYKINYYIDYLNYQKNAKKGYLDPRFMDRHPEAFSKYKDELRKTATMQFKRIGDEGVFIEIPGARFTELTCSSDFIWNFDNSKPWNRGIEGVVCTVLDEASHKWLAFDARGKFIEHYVFSSSDSKVDVKSIIARSFLASKPLSSVKVGRSVSERALYVTTGDSKIYRLSLEGIPDFRIEILTSQSSGP
jgi:hypothetical protein